MCSAAEDAAFRRGYDTCKSEYGTIEAYKKEALDIVTIGCPRCGIPYYDWMSCGAVTCSNCHAYFCIACETVFESDHATHEHIRRGHCKALSTIDAYHFSRQSYRNAKRQSRDGRVPL